MCWSSLTKMLCDKFVLINCAHMKFCMSNKREQLILNNVMGIVYTNNGMPFFAVSTMSNVVLTSNSQQPIALKHSGVGYTPETRVILTEHKLTNQYQLCEYVK